MAKRRETPGSSAVRAELPTGTWCIRVKGKVYCYNQPGRGSKKPGERVRVPYTPDDPKFWQWHQEKGLWGISESGTLGDVVEQWLASPTYAKKAEATKKTYVRYADQMIDRWDARPINSITREDLLEWRRGMEDRAPTANYAMAVARTFWRWAIGATLAQNNPAKDIEDFDMDPKQADPWPEWALQLVAEKGRWDVRAFVALALYTGQCTADVVRMSLRDIVRGEIRVLEQKKRGKELWIPIHPLLAPIIAEARKRGSIYIIPRDNGQPHTAHNFRALFYRETRKGDLRQIGEAGLSPHGLRALAVNTLLEAGCTPAEVAGITDQSLGIIERYARQRDQRKFARRAMGKWTSALEETDGER